MTGVLKNIKEKLMLLLISLAIIALIVGSGLYFAEVSSTPEFKSQIERIMYDSKNRSPKYILTLPDKILKNPPKQATSEDNKNISEPKSYQEYQREIMASTPNLSKLPEISNFQPLKNVIADTSLQENKQGMILPKISEDGRKPWVEYSSDPISVAPNFFKVAILVKGAGLDRRTTNAVIDRFPAEVALSFSPYGSETKQLVEKARQKGHETYLDLYLSSKDFLKSDSGPLSMSMTAGQDENFSRFEKSLNNTGAIIGVVVNRGIADENNRSRIAEFLTRVRDMGLAAVDATGEDGVKSAEVAQLPRSYADIVIDEDFSKDNITAQIEKAEILAQKNGKVIIAVQPKPGALVALYNWVQTFSPQLSYEQLKEQNLVSKEVERPFALVPLSSVISE